MQQWELLEKLGLCFRTLSATLLAPTKVLPSLAWDGGHCCDPLEGQLDRWAWRGAAAGRTSCAPSTSREEQVLTFATPGFPSGLIPP